MPRAHPGQRHRGGEQHAVHGQGALRLHLLLGGLPLRVLAQGWHFFGGKFESEPVLAAIKYKYLHHYLALKMDLFPSLCCF